MKPEFKVIQDQVNPAEPLEIFGRTKLQTVIGYRAAGYGEERAIRSFDKLIADARYIATKNIPVVYLVDINTAVGDIVFGLQELLQDPSKYDKNFLKNSKQIIQKVNGIVPSLDNKDLVLQEVKRICDQFPAYSADANYMASSPKLQKVGSQLKQALESKISIFNLKQDFINPIKSLYQKIAILQAQVSAAYANVDASIGPDQELQKYKDKALGKIQTATNNLGQTIRAESANIKQLIDSKLPARLSAAETESILQGFDKDTQILFLGRTYISAVTEIVNTQFKPIYEEFFRSIGLEPATAFTPGVFTAAGHSAVVAPANGGNRVVGINTPLTNQVDFATSTLSLPDIPSKIFAEQTGHINSKFTFKAEFAEDAKILLDLGFQFLVSMNYRANAILGTAEKNTMDRLVKDLVGIEKDALIVRFAKAVGSPETVKALVEKTKVNPTIKQFITTAILSSLTGKPVKQVGRSGTVKGQTTPFVQASNKKNIVNSLSKSKSKALPPPKVRKSRAARAGTVKSVSLVNLASLLVLINNGLTQAIKRNMGDGSRRDVLNLRSGRFAESAKVETISESRQGMITAFYSYMKNPYATFSDGGRQQFPKSRNPKLLISKSIRELVSQQVSNRLRAVSL